MALDKEEVKTGIIVLLVVAAAIAVRPDKDAVLECRWEQP